MEFLSFLYIICAIFVAFALGILFLIIKRRVADQKVYVAEQTAKRMMDEAERDAAAKRKESALEAKDEALKLRAEFERETKERKAELLNLEKRLLQKEDQVEAKGKEVEDKVKDLKEKENTLGEIRQSLEVIRQKQTTELEKVSGMSKEEAKKLLLSNLEKDIEIEAAQIIKQKEEQIKKEADRKAKEILTTAIQRCAVDHVVETTTSAVELPNEEMKGRIIGKEGRNIRAFETLTGVDLIVDDTPEAVILSSFDPLRREIAKVTLGKLIVDGRIHPARVEETYAKAKEEIKQKMLDYGEKAVEELEIHNMPPVLTQLIGRLRYRTSYGQNVLQHSIEVAYLAGMLAEELGVNAKLAKRAGLLHDIGKAIDQDLPGTHPKLGMLFAQKAGESDAVLHCIIAHHEDEAPRTVEAVLVLVADAISASRPGARRDTLEAYVKRLQNLEGVAKKFEGVEKVYAIQAGREVRVIVEPTKIDDLMATKLAHDIARKIEAELDYPGEVKVTVIRETRSSGVAK